MKQGVKDLVRLQPAFDQANLDTFGIIDGIYVAFYTQYPPQQRQAEVAKYGEEAWKRIGPISVGEVEAHSLQPGCLVTLIKSDKRFNIPAPSVTLASYGVPDGQPGPLLINAVASPQPENQSVQAVFGEQILLDSFSFVSAKSGASLKMKPGQAICIVLNWQSAGNLTADYTVFVHLVGPVDQAANTSLWAQHDSMPVEARRPTTSWQPGEVIQDMHVIFIPADSPQATYQLNVGLYNAATGQRLSVQHGNGKGGEQVTLMEISVQ